MTARPNSFQLAAVDGAVVEDLAEEGRRLHGGAQEGGGRRGRADRPGAWQRRRGRRRRASVEVEQEVVAGDEIGDCERGAAEVVVEGVGGDPVVDEPHVHGLRAAGVQCGGKVVDGLGAEGA